MYDLEDLAEGDLEGVGQQIGTQQIYDEIPEFFVNKDDEKIQKNGTAKFQNLDQLIKEGEGDIELLSDHEKQNDQDLSNENPLNQSDSFDGLMKMGNREKGISIQDIPKIPIEKVHTRNNENSGLVINHNMSEISSSYDPNMHVNNLYEQHMGKSEEDLYLTSKSIEFNSHRLQRKNREISTRRESDSQNPRVNKSRQFDNDEELLIESLMKNASQIQHVMKDYMESSRNGDQTEREDRHELKDEISTMRDKIYRTLEDYKDQIEHYHNGVDTIEEILKVDLQQQKEEIEDFIEEQNQHTESVEHLNNFEEFLEMKSLEIQNLESQIYDKDTEVDLLQKKVKKLNREYESMLKSMQEKINISHQEYEEMKDQKSDLQSSLSAITQKVEIKQIQVDEELKNIQDELQKIEEYNQKVEQWEKLKAENSQKTKETKEITENNLKIEDQIKLILQMNFDQGGNFENLVAENKAFLEEMRKIQQEKRQDVNNALDLMIRKHLVCANL